MLEWTAYGSPRSDRPHAIRSETGQRIEAPRLPTEPTPDVTTEISLLKFYAPNSDAAVAYFQDLIKDGVSKAQPIFKSIVKGAPWRFRGVPHYMNPQGFRLRVAQIIVDRAKDNKEIWRINTLLTQLCEAYHRMRKERPAAIPGPTEKASAMATLAEARRDLDRLHVLAATSEMMITEAYGAFDLTPPEREHWVVSIHDVKPETIPDPPVADEAPPEPEKPVEPPAPEQPKHPSPPRHHNPNRGK